MLQKQSVIPAALILVVLMRQQLRLLLGRARPVLHEQQQIRAAPVDADLRFDRKYKLECMNYMFIVCPLHANYTSTGSTTATTTITTTSSTTNPLLRLLLLFVAADAMNLS